MIESYTMINNIDNKTIKEIKTISLSMFRKGFFSIFSGAISCKLNENKFVINKSGAIFDDISPKSLVVLSHKRNYSWNDASTHADIHSYIYKEISEAKCIAYTLPSFSIAYSISHFKIIPQDYYGYINFKEIPIYDPREYSSWRERADVEICNFFKQNNINFMVIKGYGIYAYSRDLAQLAKTIDMIENSVKILTLHNLENTIFRYKVEATNPDLF